MVESVLGGTWFQFRDIYKGQVKDLGFLTFNPASKKWLAIGIDRTGNAVTTSGTAWQDRSLVLVAETAEIVGERVTLRQTLTKLSDNEYRILNEERLGDGSWVPIDEYVYSKK